MGNIVSDRDIKIDSEKGTEVIAGKKMSIVLGLGLVILPWVNLYAMDIGGDELSAAAGDGVESEDDAFNEKKFMELVFSEEAADQILSAEEQNKRHKALFDAIEDGDNGEAVRRIAELGVDFTVETIKNTRGQEGMTPLMLAVYLLRPHIINVLLECKADVNGLNKKGDTSLAIAADYDTDAMVRMLLKAKADVNKGRSLVIAAGGGHEKIVRLLLKNKADVNQADERGFTALSSAVLYRYTNTIKILLDHKADVNMSYMNQGSVPLLLWSFFYGGSDEHMQHIQKMLLDGKADVDVVDEKDQTALTWAVRDEGRIEKVRTLLDRKADVNKASKQGSSPIACKQTPLMYASMNGCAEAVQLLLDGKANVNTINEQGRTALMYTSGLRAGMQTVKLLLERKAHINYVAQDGTSALSNAFDADYMDTVQLLLRAQADPNARTVLGGPLIMMAICMENKLIARELAFAGARLDYINEVETAALDLATPEVAIMLLAAHDAGQVVEDQDWLPEWLLESHALDAFLDVHDLRKLVDEYATYYMHDTDLNELVKDRILRNKRKNIQVACDTAEEGAVCDAQMQHAVAAQPGRLSRLVVAMRGQMRGWWQRAVGGIADTDSVCCAAYPDCRCV